MPSTMTTPSSTEMLRVKPIACSTAKVPASENGIPSPTKSAMREPRNTQEISKYQCQAEQGVGLHDADRDARRDGLVVEQGRLDAALRQQRIALPDVVIDLPDQIERVGIALFLVTESSTAGWPLCEARRSARTRPRDTSATAPSGTWARGLPAWLRFRRARWPGSASCQPRAPASRSHRRAPCRRRCRETRP